MIAGYEFHGLGTELVDFAFAHAQREGLYTSCIFDSSDEGVDVYAPGDKFRHPNESNALRWICLTTSVPDVAGVNQDFNFIKKNPDRLSFLLGADSADSLGPAMLQYPTDRADSPIWKRIAAAFKRTLKKGGWIYAPEQNAKRKLSSALFSEGAIQLHESGLKALVGTGRADFRIPGLQSADPRLAGAIEA